MLAWLLAPLLIRRLHRPGPGHDGLRNRRGERRGQLAPISDRPIWVHAASVGEVNAARGLIDGLRRRFPDCPVLLSTFTVAGALHAERVLGDQVSHRFLPIDNLLSVRRWLEATAPRAGIIVETEIWPELFEQAARRRLPLIMVNARLSDKTMRQTRRFKRLYARALAHVDLALCQTNADAERLKSLGVGHDKIEVSGNLKFDNLLPADTLQSARKLHQDWGLRPTWVAGSTRPGEESIILKAHARLLTARPAALLVLAPRHPERCAEVIEQIKLVGLRWRRFDQAGDDEHQVVLVDKLGVLTACYAAAQVCFVGGSLAPFGGHNLLEPAALGKPVLAGPFLDQQQAAADALIRSNALSLIENAESLAEMIDSLWDHPERALAQGRAALGVVESGRGALRLTLDRIGQRVSAGAD